MRAGTIVTVLMRLALAGVYLFAAVPKLIDPWDFARAINNFRILPDSAVPWTALWLPAFEAVAALAVLTGLLHRGGLLAIAGLSGAFAAGVASAMIRGLDIECGCFGSTASSHANLEHLALNVGTLLAAVILLVAGGRHAVRNTDPYHQDP